MKHHVSNDELCYLSEKTWTGSTVAGVDSVEMLWFGTYLYLVTVYVCVLCLLRISYHHRYSIACSVCQVFRR